MSHVSKTAGGLVIQISCMINNQNL